MILRYNRMRFLYSRILIKILHKILQESASWSISFRSNNWQAKWIHSLKRGWWRMIQLMTKFLSSDNRSGHWGELYDHAIQATEGPAQLEKISSWATPNDGLVYTEVLVNLSPIAMTNVVVKPSCKLTLSLPRVINFKFHLQPHQKYNVCSVWRTWLW